MYTDRGYRMNIAILGYGVVGTGVEKLCIENGINVSHILIREGKKLSKPNMTSDINDILNDPDTDLIVECMGGLHPAYDYVKDAIIAKKHVVSSNKKMLAKYLIELDKLAKENNVSLLFSSACGGGIPWLRELANISNSDEVLAYKGIMNGTSNYILYSMAHDGLDFNEALKNAQQLGYAEADPSDDIDGIDTANKTILSAAIAFNRYFALDDLFISGIRHVTTDDLKYAKTHDYSLALLGKGIKQDNKYSLSVMPTFLPKDMVIANIVSNYNCFELSSKSLGKVSFTGQGAGSLPTASNVLRDILSIYNPYPLRIDSKEENSKTLTKENYYIRTTNAVNIEYIKERISENTVITKPITIEDLEELTNGDPSAFIAEVYNA